MTPRRHVAAASEAERPVESTQEVSLRLPGDLRLIRLARLTASGVAAAAQLDARDVEDVRVAVDEVCTLLVACGGGGPIELNFRFRPKDVQIQAGAAAGTSTVHPDHVPLARRVLKVVTDDFSINLDGDPLCIRAHRSATPSEGD